MGHTEESTCDELWQALKESSILLWERNNAKRYGNKNKKKTLIILWCAWKYDWRDLFKKNSRKIY